MNLYCKIKAGHLTRWHGADPSNFLTSICMHSRVFFHMKQKHFQGSKLKKNVWSQFATSLENLVATLKILVVKLRPFN